MAEMIKSIFVELKDEDEANKQYDKQRLTESEKARWKPIFEQRDKLLRAIRDSKKGDITSSKAPDYIATERKGSQVERELFKFYELLDASLNEVITAGKRPFLSNLLLEPLLMYDNEKSSKDYFGSSWDDPRALFFIQKVIGYEGIQRLMPVNLVQTHQDWLDDAAEKLKNNQPQPRGTSFKIYRFGRFEAVDFYPIRRRGTSGFNFMIYGAWGRAGGGGYGGAAPLSAFRSLCQSKAAG
ncbi:MAG: hypothetical protein ACYCQI_10825 [Gammaproteobacteria bacterium]